MRREDFGPADPRDFPMGAPPAPPAPERRPRWAYAVAGLMLTCALALMVAGTAAAVWAVFG